MNTLKLKNLGVQELNAQEKQAVKGGRHPALLWGLSAFAGSLLYDVWDDWDSHN